MASGSLEHSNSPVSFLKEVLRLVALIIAAS